MEILQILHILGITFGLGGATTSDLLFFRALRNKKIDRSEFNLLKAASLVVWAGVTLLVFSGASMLYLNGGIPNTDNFYAKMTLVAVILLNGTFLVHFFVFPFLKSRLGKDLIVDRHGWKLWLLTASGAVSIVSWYGTFFLGAFRNTIDIPYLSMMGIYVGSVIFAVLIAHKMISRYLFAR